MRVLSTYGSRGDVQPLMGLAVRLRSPGTEMRVCAPPDCAERLAEVGVPLEPAGAPAGAWGDAAVGGGRAPARGAGSTRAITRAGAPQVVMPQWADQPFWAGRVAGLGIGTAHNRPAPAAESLSAVLRTAVTREIRARATAVAGTTRTDEATVAARRLVDAVGRERPPVPA